MTTWRLEQSIAFSRGRIENMKSYLIIVEKTDTGYSAYSPDLSGCVATGRTLERDSEEHA
jgi:hypothetical protein